MKLIDRVGKNDSEQFISPEQNPNTEWVYNKGVWAAYLALIFISRVLLGILLPFLSSYTLWTILHLSHALVSPIECEEF